MSRGWRWHQRKPAAAPLGQLVQARNQFAEAGAGMTTCSRSHGAGVIRHPHQVFHAGAKGRRQPGYYICAGLDALAVFQLEGCIPTHTGSDL